MSLVQRSAEWSWRAVLVAVALSGAACMAVTHAEAAAGVSKAHAADRTGAVPARKPQFGIASVYARMLDGRTTASGEPHDSDDFTAAHRTLPLGSEVRVTNLSNHRSTVVRINDRGPQILSRIIDLSPRAAAAIGLRARGKGITRVRVDVLKEPDPPYGAPASAGKDGPTARAKEASTPTGAPADLVADALTPPMP